MSGERSPELRLWRYEATEKAEPWVKERRYVLVHESYVPTCEQNYAITIGDPVTADDELLSVTRENSIGFWAEINLMQRRVRIAKDDPDYKRLIEEASETQDRVAASEKREEARAIADALILAIDDAPATRVR